MANNKTVLITGASSGIGYALAKRYLAQGANVGLCGRDKERLSDASAGNARAYPLVFDVTDMAGTITSIEGFERAAGPIDIAILNAGTHKATDAASFDTGVYRLIMDVNYFGVVNCLSPIIAAMKKRRAGVIAFMGAAAGLAGLPAAGAYCASKAAVMRIAETMRTELKTFNIDVKLILPGFVDTPLTRRNEFPMPFLIDVEEAARRIEKGLSSRRFEIAFPRRLVWLLRFYSLLPRPLYFRLARRFLPRDRNV